MCEMKANGKCNVPNWLHEQWKTRDHLDMALELESVGFDKDFYVSWVGGKILHYMISKAKVQHTQVAVVVGKLQSSRSRLPIVDIHHLILAGKIYRSQGKGGYRGGVEQEQDRCGLVQQARYGDSS